MSGSDPILPDSPLGRALSASGVPELPGGFADRVLAATRDRAAPLPELRRSGGGGFDGGGGARRWRSARRLGLATLGAGALASAAAAAGLLDNLPVTLPSAAQVWGAVTGEPSRPAEVQPASRPKDAGKPNPAIAPRDEAKRALKGKVETVEELEAVFRRIDEAREGKKATRRENVDRRIDEVLEQRRAQGLRVPTPEQEARLRQRLEQARERADTRIGQETQTRREQLRQRVEAGETLTPEDFRPDPNAAPRRPGLRRRVEELRQLPPDQQRERVKELREQRRQRRGNPAAAPRPLAPPPPQSQPQAQPQSQPPAPEAEASQQVQ